MIAGWLHARTSQSSVSVDLRDSRVSENEAIILAEMLQKVPKLTSIDVRGNPRLHEKELARRDILRTQPVVLGAASANPLVGPRTTRQAVSRL